MKLATLNDGSRDGKLVVCLLYTSDAADDP
mgnify:CR=1 FL=1